MIVRRVLKKQSKQIPYLLRFVVLFRLFFDVEFNISPLTNVNNIDAIDFIDRIKLPLVNYAQTYNNLSTVTHSHGGSILSPNHIILLIVSILWIAGILVLLSKNIKSYVKLKQSLKDVQCVSDNVYKTDRINIPLTIGFFKPKIYVPNITEVNELEYITLHEHVHIRRFDHYIKVIAFIGLSMHWFNPLVWIFYKKFEEDMEMSCDEITINTLGLSVKQDYAQSLLKHSIARQQPPVFNLNFASNNPKERIENIMKHKQKKKSYTIGDIMGILAISLVLIYMSGIKKTILPINSETNENQKTEESKIKPLHEYPYEYTLEQALVDGMAV